jgi:hypothetical protein
MATKNLARTVIEGGRTRGCSWARRASNGAQRTHVHLVSASLLSGADSDDVVYPRRHTIYREFADKLGPARRWFATQVGRPWNKVRSELFARFDIRTTPGRHIVFDHLLPEVEGRRFSRRDFAVDHSGILRKVKRT